MRISLTGQISASERRSMRGAATRASLVLVALVAVSQCVTACSQVFLTGWQIVTAKQEAYWFQAEYRRIAAVLAPGPLRYADNHAVQYGPASDGKPGSFVSWDKAQVPPSVRDELRAIFAEQRAQAVLIDGRRVNFVIRGLGLPIVLHEGWGSPIGRGDVYTRTGVIVTSSDEPGCEELATSIEMKRCEQLDGQTYFYLF
ncbi:MAG TPA: hypothetical protein VKF35_25015 [Hyphomicrobiaceae bacterium]|nr:hypothetical protein [Hyphomicrobiaceae bacterium]